MNLFDDYLVYGMADGCECGHMVEQSFKRFGED